MKRLLANTLMLIAGLVASSQLMALGLGELELKSALNQPLQAEIELIDSGDLSDDEIKSALANAEDFERAGVERVFFLTKIRFRVEGNKITLTTREPVNEPFLNFLVELNWPSGRALREYTLLLDPPTFQETQIQPLVTSPQSTAQADAPAQPAVEEQIPAAAPQSQSAASRWETELAKPGTYKVQRDDTLWQIALHTRPDRSVTPQQMMLAIQKKNPQAFIGGNINRLKTHEVLRLPDAGELESISFKSAVAEVDRQNKELSGGAQLDATGRAGTAAKTTGGKDGGEVRLLSAASDDSESAGASGDTGSETGDGRQQALENDLAIALENVDKSRRENKELRERLEALEDQINTLQRLISLKDDQLAGMQVGNAAENKQDENAATKDQLDQKESNGSAEDSVDFNYSGDKPAKGSDAEIPAEKSAPGSAAVTPVEKTPSQVAAEEAEAKKKADERRARLEALMAEQEAQRVQPTLMDSLLANPLVPAGAGIVLLLIGLLIYRALKGRKEKSEEDLTDEDLMAFADGDIDSESLDEFDFDEDNLNTGDGLNAGSDEFDLGGLDEEGGEHFEAVPQTEDVISESDIYIAYGKFEQAVELLQGSIEKEPGRTDLRLKLLEVYVEMDEASGFADAERDLQKLGDQNASEQAERMRSRLSAPIAMSAGAGAAAASMDLGDDLLTLDGDIPSLDDTASDDFADGLDFADALDLSGDLGEPVLAQDKDDSDDVGGGGRNSTLEEVPTLDLDDGLEFDLGSDDSHEEDPIPEITDFADSDDALEFDLGGLAEDDGAAEEASVNEPQSKDDNGLDFDFSDVEEIEETEPAPEATDNSDSALDVDTSSSADDDLSDLESLLDSDSEGSDELSDLSFDMGSGSDDLDQLESELDSLASDEGSDESHDFAVDLEELDAELSDFDVGGSEDSYSIPKEAPSSSSSAGSSSDEIDLDELAAADDEFDFLAGTDECATKLDLARAYIDMEDFGGAKELLQEVVQEGSDQQKTDAREMMNRLS